MAAIILLIQESPYHRLALIDELLKISGEKNVRNARVAIDALKELFLNSLLPPHQLSYFYQHEFSKDTGDEQLKKWYFEDAVKARFSTFVTILEVCPKPSFHCFQHIELFNSTPFYTHIHYTAFTGIL